MKTDLVYIMASTGVTSFVSSLFSLLVFSSWLELSWYDHAIEIAAVSLLFATICVGSSYIGNWGYLHHNRTES